MPATFANGPSEDIFKGLQQDRDPWHAMRSTQATAIAALEPLA